MKCFYHKVDLDGIGSAAIVELAYTGLNCEFIGANHGDDFKSIVDSVEKGEAVYVVDFCFPIEIMKQLKDKADLYWIDHHKSAIEGAKKAEFSCKGKLGEEPYTKAAIQLTYEFLFPNKPIPKAIDYLGLYDSWQHTKSPDKDAIGKFELGAINNIKSPTDEVWKDLVSNKAEEIIKKYIEDGTVIQQYLNDTNAKNMESSFEVEVKGLKFLAVNSSDKGSQQFDSLFDVKKHDAMLVFNLVKNEYWNVGMYTSKEGVDVSKIAIQYEGGGGHKSACGFQTKELPFKIFGDK